MYLMNRKGSVEVICGSMFSGKSEELIRRIRQAMYGNLSTIVFKPEVDNRYATDSVVTHNGSTIKAVVVDSAEGILSYVNEDVHIVAIDEAQFFDKKIIEVVDQLAMKGLRVIVAGLDTDFRGEPFGVMPTLMARSEFLTRLNAICPVCAAPASRTQRLINGKPARYDDPVILVGASESYEPRCRHHHEVLGR